MIAGDSITCSRCARDINEYRRVMGEQISGLPCVKQTHTYVVMEVVGTSASCRCAATRETPGARGLLSTVSHGRSCVAQSRMVPDDRRCQRACRARMVGAELASMAQQRCK